MSPVPSIVSTRRDRRSAHGSSPYKSECLPLGGIAPLSGIGTGLLALPSYRLYVNDGLGMNVPDYNSHIDGRYMKKLYDRSERQAHLGSTCNREIVSG